MMINNRIRYCLAGLALLWLPVASLAQTLNFSEGELSRYVQPQSTDRWVVMQPGVQLTPSDFLARTGSELQLTSNDKFELVRENRDDLGNVHLRYQQLHNGLPVDGGVLLFHYRNGELNLMNGAWAKGLNIASFSPMANDVAQQTIGMAGPGLIAYDPELELTQEMLNAASVRHVHPVITFEPFADDAAITWFPAQEVEFEAGGKAYTAWFHAEQGHFVKLMPEFHSCNSVSSIITPCYGTITNPVMKSDFSGGQYHMSDACRKITTHKAGSTSIPSSSTNSWGSSYTHEASAQWSASAAHDYFLGKGGIQGIGDLPVLIYFQAGWNNASYYFDDIADESIITIGQHPNGNSYSPPDVVGHEFTHGIINFTAGLNYEYYTEASALNESFADIFGIITEEEATGSTNWSMAECVIAGGIRKIDGPMIDSYESTVWNANTGAHDRSGVHSYWYYLLSDGGSGINTSPTTYNYNVSGIGKYAAADIALRNLTVYLHPLANMHDARKGGIQSAIDLYGQCSNEVAQCTEAFDAIGVYDQFSSQCGITVCADITEDVCGTSNGSIALNTYPGGGITYAWSHGPSSATVSGLPAGTYTVTVTDPGIPCSYTQTYEVEASTLDFRVSEFPSFPSNMNDHRAIDILHDNNGNTWLLGQFQSELQWDGLQAFRGGGPDEGFYLAKYTDCGEIEFLVYSDNGAIGLELQEMAIDHHHNQVIITGHNGNAGGMPLFRVDGMGVTPIGNVNPQPGHGLAISISMSGTLNWSNTNLAYNDPNMGFVKMQPAAVDVDDFPQSMPVGQYSAIYLAGNFDNTVSAIVRLDPTNGSTQWYTAPFGSLISPGVIFNTLTDVEAEIGRVNVCGYFNTYLGFMGQNYTPNSSQDGMIAQLIDVQYNMPPAGNWITQFGSNDRAACYDLAYDFGNNVVYVTGTYRQDLFLGTLAWWNSQSISLSPLPGASTHDHAFVWKLNASDGLFKTTVPDPGTGQQIDQTGWFYLFGSYEGGALFEEPQVILGNNQPGTVEEVYVGGEVDVTNPMTLPVYDESFWNSSYNQLIHEPGERYFVSRFTINYAGSSNHGQLGIQMATAGGGNTGTVHYFLRPNFFTHADGALNDFGGIAHANNRIYVHGTMRDNFVVPRLSLNQPFHGFNQAFVVRHETVDGVEYRTDESLSSELEAMATGWSVFPNPASDELTVMIDDDNFDMGSMVTLTDLSGRTVLSERMTAPTHRVTDLSRLSAGTYLLSLSGSGDSRSQLIVIR